MNQQSPEAGWYPNPEGEGQRYWDGSRWTEHYHSDEEITQQEQPAPDSPWWRTPAIIVGVVLGLALLVVVGGEGDEETVSTDTNGDNQQQEQVSSRCEDVSRDMVESMESGLTGNVTLSEAAAVKSDDFNKAWFIAAEIDGPGLEGKGDVGVWMSNSLDPGSGVTMAVDAVAQEFSDWPDADKTDAGASMAHDGARESRDCL